MSDINDKYAKVNNLIEFIEELKESKESYYLINLNMIHINSISKKDSILKNKILFEDIIEAAKQISSEKLINLYTCRYDKYIVLIKVSVNSDYEVVNVLQKIVEHSRIRQIKLRGGYFKIEKNVDIQDFLLYFKFLLKKDSYDLYGIIDGKFDLSKDIKKYKFMIDNILNNNDEFIKLLYQPKINIEEKNITSCEVLSRWNDEVAGEISPVEFLPIIRDFDMETEFNLLVFEKACKEISLWNNIVKNFSINISIKDLCKNEFIEQINKIKDKYNIESTRITFEVLEDTHEDYSVVSCNINIMSKLGYKFSIDDFGEGYSSYYRLSSMRYSEIKIPKVFLDMYNQGDSQRNKIIIRGIVDLCKNLNCKVVMEGVETFHDFKLCRELNIDYIQGFYFSKPINIYDYGEKLKKAEIYSKKCCNYDYYNKYNNPKKLK